MINKKKREEVEAAATALKSRIKGVVVPPKPAFTTEFIYLKEKDTTSTVVGIRVKGMDKHTTESVKSVFKNLPANKVDQAEDFLNACNGLATALFQNKKEEMKQFRSEDHLFSYYEKDNELDILTREGCGVYGIPFPKPEPVKVVKKDEKEQVKKTLPAKKTAPVKK